MVGDQARGERGGGKRGPGGAAPFHKPRVPPLAIGLQSQPSRPIPACGTCFLWSTQRAGTRSGSPARPGGTITPGRGAPRSRSRGEVEKGWETQSLGRRTAAQAQRETRGALCRIPQLIDDNQTSSLIHLIHLSVSYQTLPNTLFTILDACQGRRKLPTLTQKASAPGRTGRKAREESAIPGNFILMLSLKDKVQMLDPNEQSLFSCVRCS